MLIACIWSPYVYYLSVVVEGQIPLYFVGWVQGTLIRHGPMPLMDLRALVHCEFKNLTLMGESHSLETRMPMFRRESKDLASWARVMPSIDLHACVSLRSSLTSVKS